MFGITYNVGCTTPIPIYERLPFSRGGWGYSPPKTCGKDVKTMSRSHFGVKWSVTKWRKENLKGGFSNHPVRYGIRIGFEVRFSITVTTDKEIGQWFTFILTCTNVDKLNRQPRLFQSERMFQSLPKHRYKPNHKEMIQETIIINQTNTFLENLNMLQHT